MCGIVGLTGRASVTDRGVLATMRDTMAHRGPDNAGEWWSADSRVGLAQRRLAVLDLSPRAHQPMPDAAGTCCITFNGEIYNHRELRDELRRRGHSFRSTSDTEVVLAAYREWGEECLSRLCGMFAFGVYDRENGRLFVARDRAGEKPLFYRHDQKGFSFASELKALVAHPDAPRALDPDALEEYLTYGYVGGANCLLRGYRKLPPGHAASYDCESGELKVWAYWRLPQAPPDGSGPGLDALCDELDALLFDSVQRQLVADVPVGVLLSGGIDSSLVTAMAARSSAGPIKAFTVTFPGDSQYNEEPYARMVARHCGAEHHCLVAEPASVTLLPRLARQYDEPIGDSSILPTYLVCRLVRQHAVVALSGDGGDELFAGYPHYSSLQRRERLHAVIPAVIANLVRSVAGAGLPTGMRGRNFLLTALARGSGAVAQQGVYFDAWARRRLLAEPFAAALAPERPESARAASCEGAPSILRASTENDFRRTLADAYLVKVDRAAMLNSLEVRAPWLDHRIIEFAFGRVPALARATSSAGKVLPRRLAARLMPPSLDLERKQGFSIPLGRWFDGAFGDYMEEVLAGTDSRLFKREAVAGLLAGQRRGYSNTSRLFALTMFELWRREYRVSW